jgi:uroporphyrinogen decarboxylase
LPTAGAVPVTDLKKAASLHIPDPLKDGRMPVYLEAVTELKSLFRGTVAIRGTGTGPFSLAAYVMGIQDFLTKLMDIETGLAESWEEAALRGLLDLMSDTLIAFLKAQILAGIDIAYIGDSLASMNMISPGMYRSFAYPYHKKVIDAVRQLCQSYGAHTVLHICGDNLAILDDLAATGVDMLDIDSRMNLAECKRRIGDQVCLVGNLDPVHMIMEGTVKEVDHAARQCIDQAGEGGGFILSTGCFVPLHTPIDNLKQMVTAARTRKP